MSELNCGPFDYEQILAYLPHRPPFLFVDKITKIVPAKEEDGSPKFIGTEVYGEKTFHKDDPIFKGHFPEFPIVPGVVLTEAMGQVGTFAYFPFMHEPCLHVKDGKFLSLVGVDKARFRKPVLPEDLVEIHIKFVRNRKTLWWFECKASVDGKLVADCELLANYEMEQKI